MKIAFLSYTYWPPDFGGELLISIERFEALVKRGHDVTVLTSGHPGFASIEEQEGITILRSPMVGTRRPSRLARRVIFWLWAMYKLARMEYDVLHWLSVPGIGPASNAFAAGSFGTIAHQRGAKTVTVHALADSETAALDMRGKQKIWKRLHLRQADRIVAVSPALYRSLCESFPDKALLLPNGVRNDIFAPLSISQIADLRSQNGIPSEGIVFSFLGSIGKRKGFDVLAQAFADLTETHPEWRLWVIGPRTRAENQNLNEQEVREVCQPLDGLGSRVKYWGRVDDRQALARIIGASDVFVFPSRREGMGIAPIEAMAAGVPVIIARLPGITDLANVEGETGLYVEPGSVSDLKAAMVRLGQDSGLRQEMGRAARQRVDEAFSWESHIARWETLYSNDSRKIR